jgi:hypothetical protein
LAASKAQSVDLPPLSLRADIASVSEEDRTVEVIFSTGAAVERYDYYAGQRYIEKLSLDPAHVRMERMNSAAPLLDAHSSWSVADMFGAVVENSARIAKGLGLATLKFSRRDAVEPYWQDVLDRIIKNVSIGYRVFKYVEDKAGNNKLPIRTAIDWEPYEVSLVPMPADIGAKMRGEQRGDTNPCVVITRDFTNTDADRLRRFRLALARP